MASRVLLAGGNGYIGGATAFILRQAGFEPVIVDNFSTSRRDELKGFPVHELDLTDSQATESFFAKQGHFDAVIHFAAKAIVSESVAQPTVYFRNNLLTTANLAESCSRHRISALVHSSSCTVYGVPTALPISESAPYSPKSPYGETKVMSEQILARYASQFKVLNLRYFNPAGALPQFAWGEKHDPETHVVPNAIRAAASGDPFCIYGDQYPTADGTCIRDFIHLSDLAEAHRLAIELLTTKRSLPPAINIGRGFGSSVLEVAKTTESVTGKKLKIERHPARPGDPPELIAKTDLMKEVFQWSPKHTLAHMIEDDWRWRTSYVK